MTPSDVPIEIEDTEVVREPGTRGFRVSFRVTADRRNGEDWDVRGAALVIREDGDLGCVASIGPSAEFGPRGAIAFTRSGNGVRAVHRYGTECARHCVPSRCA